jgi:hypothetical protein
VDIPAILTIAASSKLTPHINTWRAGENSCNIPLRRVEGGAPITACSVTDRTGEELEVVIGRPDEFVTGLGLLSGQPQQRILVREPITALLKRADTRLLIVGAQHRLLTLDVRGEIAG